MPSWKGLFDSIGIPSNRLGRFTHDQAELHFDALVSGIQCKYQRILLFVGSVGLKP